MILGPVRRTIWRLTHRRFTSAEDYFRKRTRFGEINEFFKFQVISSDQDEYTLPFLTSPVRSRREKGSWSHRPPLDYEYTNEHPERENALRHFDIAYDFVKDRVEPGCKIFDVGCAAGWFLERWRENGFKNLYGLDANTESVDWAHQHRPHLDIKQGFFGPPENDIECDLLVFFQTITRIPYEDRLFDAIDRCVRKYVLVAWVEDSLVLFSRDLHLNLAKKGFLCIEKRVVSDPGFIPIGMKGADGPLISKGPSEKYMPNFTSHFLFRRIEPCP